MGQKHPLDNRSKLDVQVWTTGQKTAESLDNGTKTPKSASSKLQFNSVLYKQPFSSHIMVPI
jgi:hypothetical protein